MKHIETQEKKFEQLYKRNYRRLFYYALDWVAEEEAARDIVGEVFSNLWETFERWDPYNEDLYLSIAVRNRCISFLRRKAVKDKAMQSYLEERKKLIHWDITLQEEQMERVKNVMVGLSDKVKYVIEQHYLEGKSYKELAEQMESSVPMIHKYISKGLAALRKALSHSVLEDV